MRAGGIVYSAEGAVVQYRGAVYRHLGTGWIGYIRLTLRGGSFKHPKYDSQSDTVRQHKFPNSFCKVDFKITIVKTQSCLHCAFSKILFLRSSPLWDWPITYSNNYTCSSFAQCAQFNTKYYFYMYYQGIFLPSVPLSAPCALHPHILPHHPRVPSLSLLPLHPTSLHRARLTHCTHRTHCTPTVPPAPYHCTPSTVPLYHPHRTHVPHTP